MIAEYATVNDMIEKLKQLSEQGYGDYALDCNDEYFLALKADTGKIDHKNKIVSFGGYRDE